MRVWRWILFISVALSVICAAGAVPGATPEAHAIENGLTVKNPPLWAAYISSKYGTCTGELIGTMKGDGVVLTAAHCLYATVEDAKTKKKVKIKVPETDFRVWLGSYVPGHEYAVADAVADEHYRYDSLEYDVAVLRLNRAPGSGDYPVALAPRSFAVPNGKEVNAVGFGCVAEEWSASGAPVPGHCARTTTLHETQARSYHQEAGCDLGTAYCFEQRVPDGPLPDNESAILQGDSGGSWLLNVPDPYVVGISSHLTHWDKTDRRYSAVFVTRTSFPQIHDWLKSEADLAAGTPGHIYEITTKAGTFAWLLGKDGFLHPIGNASVLACLAADHQVDKIPYDHDGYFRYSEMPKDVAAPATCARPEKWKGVELPLPSDKSTTYPAPTLANVACTWSGECAAVGSYADNSGDNLAKAFIDSGSGTSWTAEKAPVPQNATSDNASLTAVACGKTCAAIGPYASPSGSYTMIDAGSGGAWTSVTAPVPHGFVGGGLSYVACGTECVAAGAEYGADGTAIHEGLLESGTGGSWKESVAPLPGNAHKPDPGVSLAGAACGSGDCVVYGTYVDKSGVTQGLVETESGGKWAAAQIPYPANTGTGQGFAPSAAACQSATACTVVGQYATTRGAGWTAMVTGSGTHWKSVALPLAFINAPLNSISCPSATSCTAAGAYISGQGEPRILTVKGEGATWTERFAQLPPHGSNLDLWVWPQGGGSVSCSSAASCVIAGTYYADNTHSGPFVSTERNGAWTTILAPVPGNSQRPVLARLYSVSCPPDRGCVAAGWYAPASSIPNGPNGLPFVAVEV